MPWQLHDGTVSSPLNGGSSRVRDSIRCSAAVLPHAYGVCLTRFGVATNRGYFARALDMYIHLVESPPFLDQIGSDHRQNFQISLPLIE
jgi:hypothetical protein